MSERFHVSIACVVLVSLASAMIIFPMQRANAQDDLRSLTDNQIIEQIHRAEYVREFDRRMRLYTPEKRRELAEKRTKMPRQRVFPDGYTDDELIAHARQFSDNVPAMQAVRELGRRYSEADAPRVTAMASRLRAEFGGTTYPAMTADNYNSPSYHASSDAYLGLTAAVKACLPEEIGLELLWEVYVAPRPYRGVSHFLEAVRGHPFVGQATVDALMNLRVVLTEEYTPDEFMALGENANLLDLINSTIAHCGEAGFAVFKVLDWNTPIGIQTMGSIDSPEARQLLLDLYEQTQPEHVDIRLNIVGALSIHQNPKEDGPARDLLRRELPAIILGGHYDRPTLLSDAIQIAEGTRDPYYLEALYAFQRGLTIARILEAVPASEADGAMLNFRSLNEFLANSIRTLEKVAATGSGAQN